MSIAEPPVSPSATQPVDTAAPALGHLTAAQASTCTGLAEWQWKAAVAAKLIPAADAASGRWPLEVVDDAAARREHILTVVGTDPPVGGHRAAERLAARTGLPVEKSDVEALADAGQLVPAGSFKGWPLWDCRALDGIDTNTLSETITQRHAWIAASVSRRDAPEYLGWRREEFQRIAEARNLQLGRFDRYDRAALDALAADESITESVRADRLLMRYEAATYLEIRETDFKYLVAADLAVPREYARVSVPRGRSVSTPMYRVGDLEALLEHPDIDWEAARAVRPGEPSPLRHLARRPVDRAALIRRSVAELGDRYGVEIWAWWHPGARRWELDFERVDGGLTVRDLQNAIATHPSLRRHRGEITVATRAGAAIRWARAMSEPGAAVILDTETTALDGYVVEVAVIDAATGDTLLDTLVNPGCPVNEGARWVHGITDEQLTHAPPLAQVWPQLRDVTTGRTVLAYNAPFDRAALTRHARRDNLDPGHLADPDTWACVMNRRSDWQMRSRRIRLGGGHRALADCQAAYDVLRAMTSPASFRTPRRGLRHARKEPI